MKLEIEPISCGVVAASGFAAGGVFAGLKRPGKEKRDLGMITSEVPCEVAGTFSRNSILSPSVVITRRAVKEGRRVKVVVANSGCANCAVGEQGLVDAEEIAGLAAAHAGGAKPEEVLVASTGVIGVELPMALIRKGIPLIETGKTGGREFAHAILTTDTRTKEYAVRINSENPIIVGGVAKGSGMIHPNMATMLAFITTDAAVERSFLQKTLSNAVTATFNQIDVDGDQSTNDMVLLLANSTSGNPRLSDDSSEASAAFAEAVMTVCEHLAKEIARDGEGAQHLIEALVDGAASDEEARRASRAIVSSVLVKTAIYGKDPNWGRIVMAVGKSGVLLDESNMEVFIGGIQIVAYGKAIAFNVQSVVQSLASPEVKIHVCLNIGDGSGRAWGCDLTEEYVVFNSAYTT